MYSQMMKSSAFTCFTGAVPNQVDLEDVQPDTGSTRSGRRIHFMFTLRNIGAAMLDGWIKVVWSLMGLLLIGYVALLLSFCLTD